MNAINIYIVFTPFQAISASEIQKQKLLKGEHVTFCFLKKDAWNEEILGRNTVYLYGSNAKQRLLNLRAFRKQTEEMMRNNKEVNAIISHAFHPAANYLMFSKRITSRYIMPEGILNYYHRQIDLKFGVGMLAKKAACATIGFPYKIYNGHLSGHETGRYDAAFCFRRKGLVTTGKVSHEIQFTQRQEQPHGKKVAMILDQDIESILPKKIASTMRRMLEEYIKEQEFDIIYHKSHYTQQETGKDTDNKPSPNILDKNTPAEIYINKIHPTHIVSFISSALLHAKLINPSIYSIAIYPKSAALALGNRAQGVNEVMNQFGVEIIT